MEKVVGLQDKLLGCKIWGLTDWTSPRAPREGGRSPLPHLFLYFFIPWHTLLVHTQFCWVLLLCDYIYDCFGVGISVWSGDTWLKGRCSTPRMRGFFWNKPFNSRILIRLCHHTRPGERSHHILHSHSSLQIFKTAVLHHLKSFHIQTLSLLVDLLLFCFIPTFP